MPVPLYPAPSFFHACGHFEVGGLFTTEAFQGLSLDTPRSESHHGKGGLGAQLWNVESFSCRYCLLAASPSMCATVFWSLSELPTCPACMFVLALI